MLEGPFEVGDRFVAREPRERSVSRRQRVAHRLGLRARHRGLTEVMGEGVEVVGPANLERFGHRAMQAHSTARAELVVQRRTDERVREPPAIDLHLVEQAGFNRRGHRGEHLVLALAARPHDDVEIELASDDRRHSQHLVRHRAEAAEAPADHVTHALGNADAVDRDVDGPSAVALEQGARLREVSEHLDDEERIALGFVADRAGELEALGPRLVAGVLPEEVDDILGREAVQRAALRSIETAEVRQRVGQRVAPLDIGVAVRADDEHPHRSLRPHDVVQEQQGRPSRPMHVVEHEKDGALVARRREPVHDRVEHPIALGLRIGSCGRRDVGRQHRKVGHEARELAPAAAEEHRQAVGIHAVDDEAQRLDEGLVGDAQLLLAPAEKHHRTVPVHLTGELRRHACLPDAGLAGKHHDPGVGMRPGCGLPSNPELVHLLRAADERDLLGGCERRRQRQVDEGRGVEWSPHNRTGLDRLGQALQGECADALELVPTSRPRECACKRRHQDLTALRGAAQPRRLDHGGAEEIVSLSPRVAGADADPQREGRRVRGRLLDRDASADRVSRASERGHVAVAEAFDEQTVVALDRCRDGGIDCCEQHVGLVVTEPAAELRRADDVGEEHGPRATFDHDGGSAVRRSRSAAKVASIGARVTRSSRVCANVASPGPKFAAGMPCSAKRATSVHPSFARTSS